MISDLEYHIRVLIIYGFAMESQMSGISRGRTAWGTLIGA